MEGIEVIINRLRNTTLSAKNGNQQAQQEQAEKYRYKCSKCKDTGLIIIPQQDKQAIMQRCECQEKIKIERLWSSSGINTENLNKTFSNFDEWNIKAQEMKAKGIKYYQNFEKIKHDRRNSILLCGNSGSGKTHISLALANNFLKKNIKVLYMPYRDTVTEIKQNMRDEEFYKKTLSRYQTAEILLIDDLFKGRINDSDINIMFELINYRYLNYLPIMISTEFNIDKLLNFDEAIGSRIYEMCKDYIVEIEGTEHNYRLR